MTKSHPPPLPGDLTPRQALERAIRVDHAGEFGAVRIYAGQLALMRHGPAKDKVRKMAEQEAHHLETFEKLIAERRVRPTGPHLGLACGRLGFGSGDGGDGRKGCHGMHGGGRSRNRRTLPGPDPPTGKSRACPVRDHRRIPRRGVWSTNRWRWTKAPRKPRVIC